MVAAPPRGVTESGLCGLSRPLLPRIGHPLPGTHRKSRIGIHPQDVGAWGGPLPRILTDSRTTANLRPTRRPGLLVLRCRSVAPPQAQGCRTMEFVLVVPRTMLFPESTPHGLVPFDGARPAEAVHACVESHGFFVEREYAERTPSLKQVIPYSIVVRHRPGDEPEVLCLRRTTRGGEPRLHDKLSIGVGGHIDPEDLPDGSNGPKGRAARIPV